MDWRIALDALGVAAILRLGFLLQQRIRLGKPPSRVGWLVSDVQTSEGTGLRWGYDLRDFSSELCFVGYMPRMGKRFHLSRIDGPETWFRVLQDSSYQEHRKRLLGAAEEDIQFLARTRAEQLADLEHEHRWHPVPRGHQLGLEGHYQAYLAYHRLPDPLARRVEPPPPSRKA
jgi:hypothetical protein